MRTNAVGIVGLGYVGLTTAVCFANRGFQTIGVDVDKGKLAKIARGQLPFVEPGLAKILQNQLRTKRLTVTTNYDELTRARVQFITVGTPSSDGGSNDLRYVRKAAASVGQVLRESDEYHLVVVKSTVTPGATQVVVRPALESASRKKFGEFGLAANPEFLREGKALEDTMRPNRLVIGTEDKKSQTELLTLYRALYRHRMPKIVLTSTINAELIKYASNSFLAAKITFINEIANLCQRLPGADVAVVAQAMGLDKRIAPGFLRAGLGYGGSCFPKDTNALLRFASTLGVELGVAQAASSRNEKQYRVAIELAESLVGSLRGKRVALLGLAFKPDSDDMREATSLRLVHELLRLGARVVAFDPVASKNAKKIIGDRIDYASSVKDCLDGTDCCILVTEWPEFSKISPRQVKALMKTPAVVDGRRILDGNKFLRNGIRFAALGLGTGSEPSKQALSS